MLGTGGGVEGGMREMCESVWGEWGEDRPNFMVPYS